MPQRILVPLDHGAGALAVVDYAVALARALAATVTFFHAYDPPNQLVGMIAGATVAGEDAAARAAADELLALARARAEVTGVTVAAAIVEATGPAHAAIVRHVREGGYDLVVMGSHGRRGLARAVIGSTTEEVMRRAPCPVLSLHLPPE